MLVRLQRPYAPDMNFRLIDGVFLAIFVLGLVRPDGHLVGTEIKVQSIV
jgi:hypothetical protein